MQDRRAENEHGAHDREERHEQHDRHEQRPGLQPQHRQQVVQVVELLEETFHLQKRLSDVKSNRDATTHIYDTAAGPEGDHLGLSNAPLALSAQLL